jgi:hypothetical protein
MQESGNRARAPVSDLRPVVVGDVVARDPAVREDVIPRRGPGPIRDEHPKPFGFPLWTTSVSGKAGPRSRWRRRAPPAGPRGPSGGRARFGRASAFTASQALHRPRPSRPPLGRGAEVLLCMELGSRHQRRCGLRFQAIATVRNPRIRAAPSTRKGHSRLAPVGWTYTFLNVALSSGHPDPAPAGGGRTVTALSRTSSRWSGRRLRRARLRRSPARA